MAFRNCEIDERTSAIDNLTDSDVMARPTAAGDSRKSSLMEFRNYEYPRADVSNREPRDCDPMERTTSSRRR